MDLQSILDPVYADLKLVEQKLKKFSESSDLPLLDELIQHVFNTKGKRARPALTLLTAGFYNDCLLYTSPSPRDLSTSRMPSSA